MASASTFVEALEARRDDPVLRRFSGTIRFQLRSDGTVRPLTVTIADGAASVSRRKTKADCIATMDEALFDAIAAGEANAVTAFLRGEIEIEGEVALLLAFERAFPGPAARRAGAETSGSPR